MGSLFVARADTVEVINKKEQQTRKMTDGRRLFTSPELLTCTYNKYRLPPRSVSESKARESVPVLLMV